MRFFLDANIPYSCKDVFKKYGDVICARDVRLAHATDREIVDYAYKHNAILVTKDLEFGNVHIYPRASITAY
jgi:predicted nuclease of predicted toxin-antitoxin system